jgi:hypothetical protein
MTETSKLQGPKILLQGDSGSGKTYALATLVEWGARQPVPVETFVLFTENGLETLLGFWRDAGKPVPSNLHWHVIEAPTLSLKSLTDAAQKVGMLSYESITKMTDPERGANNPYLRILEAFSDFPDDRTGKKFGNVGSWGNDRALCIDSLTMLGVACMKMVIGSKPTASQPDFGVAQNNLMNLLRFFTQGFSPTFIMTAHLQRMQNELTGSVQLMTSAIGKAISNDIPPLFSEVIFAYREGTAWWWDTSAPNVSTKTRYLPIKSKIPPDIGQIMEKWRARGAEA